MKLTTDAELADMFGIDLDKLHALRKRHHWPCVKVGRFAVRFTDAQIDQIIAMQTEAPADRIEQIARVSGQTARSAARKRAS